jgi:hypothetical protein
MPSQEQLTPAGVRTAFTLAVLADFIQLPLNLVMFTGLLAIPSELMDMLIDGGMFVVTTRLLGFHWALVPTAMFELMPIGDVFPTWTACVAFVVWQRKQASLPAVPPASVPVALRQEAPPIAYLESLPMRVIETNAVASNERRTLPGHFEVLS